MKKLSKIEMKQLKGGNGIARNTCSTKTTCTYYDANDVLRTSVCQNKLIGGVWRCSCGNSGYPCSDQE